MFGQLKLLYQTGIVLLSGLLIFGLIPFGYWQSEQASAMGKTYLHLNFDDYPLEPSLTNPQSAPGGGGYWSLYGTKAETDYAYGEVFADKNGRSLTLVSNTTGNNINIQKNGTTIPGSAANSTVVMEGNFMVDTDEHERRLFNATLTLLPNTGAPALGTIIVYLDTAGKIKLEYPGAGGKKTIDLGNYAINSWYHIQLYVDLASKKLELLINGNYAAQDVQLLEQGWDNLSSFRFTQMGKSGVEGKLILDNIKITDYEPVSAIQANVSEITLSQLERRQLVAQVVPASSSNLYVDWYSDNPSIAEVNEAGVVTAIADGTTTIYAKSREDDLIFATVTVNVAAYAAVESVQIEPSQIIVETERTTQLNAAILPEGATNKEVSWISSNPEIATVDADGLVTGHVAGSVTVTAVSADDSNIFGTSVVTVVPRTTLTEQLVLPAAVKVYKGDTITVYPEFVPADTTNRELIWLSTDEQIAQVSELGVISGIEVGTAEIQVQVQSGTEFITAQTEVEVLERNPIHDSFEQMRMRWKDMLDGGWALNTQSQAIAEQVITMNDRARQWSESINTSNGSTNGLWSDILPSATDSSFFNTYLTRLRDMTYAYSIKGGDYYHHQTLLQQIKDGLDWIYEHAYNEQIVEYGNWWNFDIGAPLRVMDILIMLQDEMTTEEMERFVRTADHFIGDIMSPQFNSSGANRSDVMTIETLMAILTKDGTRLNHVLEQLKPLFIYVTEGDGFYEDGSYIQHGTIPYTGSYGEVLIRGLGNLFYLLKDTPWEVTDPNAVYVYRWIYDSVAPVIYRGETMDMIRGRAIAREEQTGHHATIGIMSGMIRLAMAAPAEDALYFKQLIKHWMLTTNQELDVNRALRLDLIEPLEAIMNDPTISEAEDQAAHYEFGAMNRTVHIRDNFSFGISKSSRRIATYELTNGENGEGWYTGDGMTYLYTKDTTQFADDFWPTVNRYRLPGTTVDTRPRKNDHYQYGDGETTPGNNWAGGAVLGADGISGMKLQQVGTTLTANKSWFMFGDKIVALGSGISSSDNRDIETIVEQRKLNASGDNALVINNQQQPSQLGFSQQSPTTSWMHLEGNVNDSSIGYYFPNPAALQVSRTVNEGSWYAINKNDAISKDVRVRNYMTIWYDHGKNPSNAAYSYVLLPDRTAAETKQYAENPDIVIIENSETVHAVADLQSQQTGIQFWQDQLITSAGVTSNRQASVILKNNEDEMLEVAVADPTFTNTGVIELVIDQSAAAVLEADDEVFVTQLHPVIKMQVSTAGSLSKSFRVKFDIDPSKPRSTPEAELPAPGNSKPAIEETEAIGHVEASFDQDRLGNRPYGWHVQQSANTTAVVALSDTQNNEDYALRLVDRNNEGKVTAAVEFPAQEQYAKLSWSFNDLLGNSGSSMRLLAQGEPAIELVLSANKLYWMGSDGNKRYIQQIEPTKWYRANLSASPVSGQWDLWIDGELVVAGGQFITEAAAIDKMEITTGVAQDDVCLYIDDLMVYVAGAIPLINDHFESYPAGAAPGDWLVVENKTNAPVSIVYDEEERNKSVLLDDQNTTFRATLSKHFAAQNDRFIAQWRYKELGGGKYPEFQLLNQLTPAIRLSSSSNNNFRFYGPGASANTVAALAKTKIGAWHTVKLDVRPDEQVYDIYFDGVLVEQNLGFYTPTGQIDGILFGSAYSAPDAPLYIDDVQVYAFDTDAPYWAENDQLEHLAATDSSVQLSWQAAQDNVGIGWYNIYKQNQLVQRVSGAQTEAVLTGLQPRTAYHFAVQAVDQNGNVSIEKLTVDAITQERPIIPTYPSGNSGNESNGNESSGIENRFSLTVQQLKAYLKERLLKGLPGIELTGDNGFKLLLPSLWMKDLEDVSISQFAQQYQASEDEIQLIVEAGLVSDDNEIALMLQNAVREQFGTAAAAVLTLQMKLYTAAGGERQNQAVSQSLSMTGLSYAQLQLSLPLSLQGEVDGEKLVVMRWDEQSKRLVYVPSRFTSFSDITSFPDFSHFLSSQIEPDLSSKVIIQTLQTGWFVIVPVKVSNNVFVDMNGHWAQNSVASLAAKQLWHGVAPRIFAPEQPVTRAQFAALLGRTLGLPQGAAAMNGNNKFRDIDGEEWFAPAVSGAAAAGLIRGYTDGSFRPNQPVTREEAAVLLHRASQFLYAIEQQEMSSAATSMEAGKAGKAVATVETTETSKSVKAVETVDAIKAVVVYNQHADDQSAMTTLTALTELMHKFTDAAQISNWSIAAVQALTEQGIIKGMGGNKFQPKANMTRAQMSVMIEKWLKLTPQH